MARKSISRKAKSARRGRRPARPHRARKPDAIGTLVAARLVQSLIYGALAIRLLPDLINRRRIKLGLLRPLLRIGAWVTVTMALALLYIVLTILAPLTVLLGAALALANRGLALARACVASESDRASIEVLRGRARA